MICYYGAGPLYRLRSTFLQKCVAPVRA
jgi:hypothetical protein